MSPPPRDLTPLPDLLHGRSLAGPVRDRRPVYLDRFDYDRCTGCGACFEQCPVHAIEMVRESLPHPVGEGRGGDKMRVTIDGNEAATTGVEGPADVVKYLLAGADVVMTASALLRHGPEHAAVLLDGLSAWMGRKGFAAVDQFRGILAVPAGRDETAHERADYVRALRAANSTAYRPW